MRQMNEHVLPTCLVQLGAKSDPSTNFLGFVVTVDSRDPLTKARRRLSTRRFNAKRFGIERALDRANSFFAEEIMLRGGVALEATA